MKKTPMVQLLILNLPIGLHIYQGVKRFLCRLYKVHTGSHQLILLTREDLATSESGFSSEDIYTTIRNQPHTSLY